MKQNIGVPDRIIRFTISVVLALAYFMNAVTGTFGIICFVIACILFATVLVGICPLYSLLGINTRIGLKDKVWSRKN